MTSNIRIIDNSDKIKSALDQAIDKGLEMIGLKAEGYAKRKCPVDTGLLRNSITHARAGSTIQGTYRASYGSNTYTNKQGKTVRRSATSKNAGSVGMGVISTTVGSKDEKAEYIGTNVEYAAYVELGTQRTKAQPYLKPAATEHMDEYKRMLDACIKEVLDD